ncbi:translational GTPase TypA [Sulfuriroseicoccus oceanibius]|uniref:Large ribosomal subunit assembly factor BipA n=1 Tax=Sulfuriroseicoccus oceanibius TaxID=2707525 RepID=A0A6B3L7V5_9BACT|nr:translational GTPase TypA [Sulfuriroseicoccus oceanibius]QQL44773.1 translational GTPase TypA [Sulfuriroseicoccus oceanibius]
MSVPIRNLAIIAHVDHGKTTLVDQLLQAGGTYRDNQATEERAMDSMDLEREKGITIKAKNTSIHWKDHTINIVDTPGHADFGAEVERVMKMVDGVLLVVDAAGGPQAQTRFVLRKALQQGLKPIVVVNKLDRPLADPEKVHDMVLELFLDLDASEEQFEAPFLYGSARDGYFMTDPNGERKDCEPLLEEILRYVPAPDADPEAPFKMLVSNVDWDDYVGRVAVGKVLGGSVKKGDTVWALRRDGTKVSAKVTKTFSYSGLSTHDSEGGSAGGIVGVAGFEDIDIGETLAADGEIEPLPFVDIDPPTVQMQFSINDGPFAGKEGKHVTSRAIRDRLMRELKTNISIQVEDTDVSGVFNVSARGAMQIAVLVETMRREGFELCVSRPNVIFRRDDEGKLLEPFETLYIEAPGEYSQGILKALVNRKGVMENMETEASGATFIQAVIPTRGIIGLETELVNLTSGHGIMSHLFKEYAPHAGEIVSRTTGTLVSMDQGVATTYSLQALLERGTLFVGAGDQIYAGMIVGENPRAGDLPVNPVKEKHLDNMRSAGKDKTSKMAPPLRFSLERSIEYIEADELVEATPKSLRLRKRILDANARKRAAKAAKG